MVVFWSSDPEATSGVYGAHDGTIRRQWLKELGIPCVHIDPFHNHTAQFLGGKWIAPRPGTDSAMVLAIAHVWMTEGLYDEEYVAERTVGFDKWKAYVLGEEDGVPKTPEWQEAETGVPARDLRALARAWGSEEDLSRRRRPRRLRRRLPHGHRHATGRAAWCASWPCRAWASPASTWAACSRARRSTRTSSSPATPRAATPATSPAPR